MSALVVRSYDHGRAESVGDMADRLWALLSGLGAVHAKLTGWSARATDGSLLPLESIRDCAAAIRQRAYSWKSGPREHVAYGPTVVASGGAAEIALVCGVEPFPVWTPNQVQLTLGASAGITVKDAETLEAVLSAVARAYAPAWGHVSVDAVPVPPMPPFADGTPVVGWITFLSHEYPEPPAALPEPAVARRIDKGAVLVAHPSRPDVEAIERLRATLREAGVLLPAITLTKPRVS
jgi:hypothetical protein